ncbi:hypothetical protein AB4Z54_57415 [Streptomyces sp. MCAF7]
MVPAPRWSPRWPRPYGEAVLDGRLRTGGRPAPPWRCSSRICARASWPSWTRRTGPDGGAYGP